MKIVITSTAIITTMDGVPCRLWDGVTEGGNPCQVYVSRVSASDPEAVKELDARLAAVAAPPESRIPAWWLSPSGLDDGDPAKK